MLVHKQFMWHFLECALAAGVHDSFWVHACDVDKMNQILREKFVELYSMPILENVCRQNSSLSTIFKQYVVLCLFHDDHLFSDALFHEILNPVIGRVSDVIPNSRVSPLSSTREF